MRAVFRFFALIFAGAALLAVGLGIGGYWLLYEVQRPGPLAASRTLVIPAGAGVGAIADRLASDGVIRHPLAFAAFARLSGRGKALKAGEYEFPERVSEVGAFAIIAGGHAVRHQLTIPEGLTSREILALVRAAPALTGDTGPVPPEGSLLPDTYLYSYGETRHAMIARMQRDMMRLVAQLWRERRPDLPLASPQEAVTLASIVEKETALPNERPLIAGVYLNRLRRGMKLQADPTVVFALDHDGAAKLDRKLTHADLAVESPYNTYLVKGLPPGPIANPGRAALEAAMQPQPSEDLYFVADGSGGHRFSTTLAEQDRNIDQHRRELAGGEPQPAPPAPPPLPPNRPEEQVRKAAPHRPRVAARAVRETDCRPVPGHRCRR